MQLTTELQCQFVVYVKPEENAAYYTVNGEGDESFKLPL